MREQLLGYLMAALDPEEIAEVEARLKTDPKLARDCELLRQSLEPLTWDREPPGPPPRLAIRTCAFVTERTKVRVAPDFGSRPKRWSFQDLFVTAGTVAAAALLFFPAVNFSRFQAQLAGCQNHLRQIGLALTNYSERFAPFSPPIPESGPMSTSGAYAPALVNAQLIGDSSTFLCPADDRFEASEYRVPTSDEVESAEGDVLAQLQATMGGSFGSTLGYVEGPDKKYCFTKDLNRQHFALVSDLPDSSHPEHQSKLHGGRGQNVLFEDGHVKFLHACKCPIETAGDDIFQNNDGAVGPGVNKDDSVIPSGPLQVTIPVGLSR